MKKRVTVTYNTTKIILHTCT